MQPPPTFVEFRCQRCGRALGVPEDLTAVSVQCPACATESVLPPTLIQSRQQQFDHLQLEAERRRLAEQQRTHQQQVLLARQAASRRSTRIVLLVVGAMLLLPALGVAGLFALGISLGKKAINAFEAVQDPTVNGMPQLMSELRKKQAEGCSRVVVAPSIRLGSAVNLDFEAEQTGDCIHVLAVTAAPGAHLSLMQTQPLVGAAQSVVVPAQAMDYRFCASATANYSFSVQSDISKPYSIAAVACPRSVAEGRVRSQPNDAESTGLGAARDWLKGMQAKSCLDRGEPKVVQGTQTFEVIAAKNGPCVHWLAVSHFEDVTLASELTGPDGQRIVAPAPASRIQIAYCPSRPGKHRLRVTPSSPEHYAVAESECRQP